MATDYLLFVHGVHTRFRSTPAGYADELFNYIKGGIGNSSRSLEKIVIYWGDINDEQECQLYRAYEASPHWKRFWFREFRQKVMLQFAGDAALYLSRYVGSKVADRIKDQALEYLSDSSEGDRLHLVTHSMGAVILFDILFSHRWDDPSIPGYKSVNAIRSVIFGVSPNPMQGIKLGSITTMGSPIAIFSLMDVDQSVQEATNAQSHVSTHDITPRLEQLLLSLYQAMNAKLPWRNFAHPGDPMAYPLATLLPYLVDGESQYLDVEDVVIRPTHLPDFLLGLFSQTPLALIRLRAAHSSYWHSQQVADKLAQTIDQAVEPLEAYAGAR